MVFLFLFFLCLILIFSFSDTARKGSRVLQSLNPEERSTVLVKLADLLQNQKQRILSANSVDMAAAEASGLSKPLLSRLFMTPEKLNSLSDGLLQVSESTKDCLNRCLKRTLITDGMTLKQVTV